MATKQAAKRTAKKAAAKAPGKKPPAKKTASPTKTATTRAAAKKATAWPEFITHKAITAHYQARLHNLPTKNIRDWKENRGVATITFPSGARIDHTPTGDAPFYAHTPCKNGGVHYDPIRSPQDLHAAEQAAAACTDRHGAPAARALGSALTRAKTPPPPPNDTPTPSDDPAPAPAPEPRDRTLGDTLAHSTGTAAETQPLSADEIGQHIAAQLAERADLETPKEHPDHA